MSEPRSPTVAGAHRRFVGRYCLHDAIASGGMATVHYARLTGPADFSRVVAVKRLHVHLASDPAFRAMLFDEARLSARVLHPNVVRTLDVVEDAGEVLIVMEYVLGESLSRALRAAHERVPVAVAVGIIVGMLDGLHAAHEARDAYGAPLGIVHRDVSPQNVLVGADGVPRLIDFGIAKAASRLTTTEDGMEKGKRGYMAPEQLLGLPVSRETDVYGASVVLWELLAGRRLFAGEKGDAIVQRAIADVAVRPSQFAPEVSAALDAIVLRGLSRSPDGRPPTARAMAEDLSEACPPASAQAIASWLATVAGDALDIALEHVASIEREPVGSGPSSVAPGPHPSDAVFPPVVHVRASDTPTLAPRSRSRRRASSIVAAVLMLGIAAAARSTWRADRQGAKSTARAEGAIAPSSPPREPAPSMPADAAPPASVASVARPGRETPAPVRVGVIVSVALPSPARRAPRPTCTPPYAFDAAGHKIFKPECF